MMRNVCRVLALSGAVACLSPVLAHAQQTSSSASDAPRVHVAVHVGGQAGSSSLRDAFTFSVYDETATVTTDQDSGSGMLFNVEASYAFLPRLAAGLAITRMSGDTDARVSASIPNPQVFDSPRTASFVSGDASHAETGYHFFVSYLIPASSKLDVRVFAGPSVFQVSHDVVSAVAFTETAPFTSVTITGVTVDERTKTVGAFHAGAGVTYRVTDRFGIDGLLRFARRTVDLPGAGTGTTEVKVGGPQLGIGVRIGF